MLVALSRTFRGAVPRDLLYADDLVLLADSEDLLVVIRSTNHERQAAGSGDLVVER